MSNDDIDFFHNLCKYINVKQPDMVSNKLDKTSRK